MFIWKNNVTQGINKLTRISDDDDASTALVHYSRRLPDLAANSPVCLSHQRLWLSLTKMKCESLRKSSIVPRHQSDIVRTTPTLHAQVYPRARLLRFFFSFATRERDSVRSPRLYLAARACMYGRAPSVLSPHRIARKLTRWQRHLHNGPPAPAALLISVGQYICAWDGGCARGRRWRREAGDEVVLVADARASPASEIRIHYSNSVANVAMLVCARMLRFIIIVVEFE